MYTQIKLFYLSINRFWYLTRDCSINLLKTKTFLLQLTIPKVKRNLQNRWHICRSYVIFIANIMVYHKTHRKRELNVFDVKNWNTYSLSFIHFPWTCCRLNIYKSVIERQKSLLPNDQNIQIDFSPNKDYVHESSRKLKLKSPQIP